LTIFAVGEPPLNQVANLEQALNQYSPRQKAEKVHFTKSWFGFIPVLSSLPEAIFFD